MYWNGSFVLFPISRWIGSENLWIYQSPDLQILYLNLDFPCLPIPTLYSVGSKIWWISGFFVLDLILNILLISGSLNLDMGIIFLTSFCNWFGYLLSLNVRYFSSGAKVFYGSGVLLILKFSFIQSRNIFRARFYCDRFSQLLS